MPAFLGLADPGAQQMAFAGTFLPPNVYIRGLLLLQYKQQFAVGITEKFIEAGLILAGNMENKLGHGGEEYRMEFALIVRVFNAQRQETAFIR